MIGAGSVVFSRNLTGDILGYPEFRDATFSYMDVDQERLQVGAALCRKTAEALGAKPKIEGHDRPPQGTRTARISSSTWCKSAASTARWSISRFPENTG